MASPREHTHPPIGFTLLEILLASIVLGVALVAASWSLTAAASSRQTLREGPYTATLLAKEIRALASTLPRQPSGQLGATSAGEVAALDSLIGARFNPPLRSDLRTFVGLTGWTQVVDLDVYDTGDLTTPAADDPALGIAPGASKLYGLSVSIEEAGEGVATFRWWITP